MTKIAVDRILPNPEQPRDRIDEDELKGLADSILEHGLINPIAVEEADPDQYILIDGERRWRAARLAGLTEIEANVRRSVNGAGSRERLTLAMVANLQREDMNPIEEGKAYQKLQEFMSVDEIARQTNQSISTINLRLQLLELEPEIQDLFAKRKLPIGWDTVAALLMLPDERRVPMARLFAMRGTTIAYIKRTCSRIANNPITKRTVYRKTSYEDLEDEEIPSFRFAKFKQRTHKKKISEPDIEVWEDIREHAAATCKYCPLVEYADKDTCGECPLVDMIGRLIENL